MIALGSLVETVLSLLYPNKGYKLQFRAIYYLAPKDEPAIAEQLFTILTYSKIQNGGFNVAEPG